MNAKNTFFCCATCKCYLDSEISYNEHFRLKHKNMRNRGSCQPGFGKAPEPLSVLTIIPCQVIITKMEYFSPAGEETSNYSQPVARAIQIKKKRKLANKHQCAICAQTFRGNAKLERHIITRHTNEKHFQCDKCNARFVRSDGLKRHSKIHSEKSDYSCPNCPRSFRQSASLESHINSEHKTYANRKKYQCTLCPLYYFTPGKLAGHRRRVHFPERSRKFQCEICPKSFHINVNLKSHILTHTAERPFDCDTCPRSFKQAGNLRSHKKTHEIGTRTREFICDKCDKTYFFKSQLTSHLKTVHFKGEIFFCPICNRGFAYNSLMTTHFRSHLEERAHKCEVCGRAFKSGGTLNVHKKKLHTL